MQKGMWAMIACSIALAVWTTVLLFWTVRVYRKQAVHRDDSSTRGIAERGRRRDDSIADKDEITTDRV